MSRPAHWGESVRFEAVAREREPVSSPRRQETNDQDGLRDRDPPHNSLCRDCASSAACSAVPATAAAGTGGAGLSTPTPHRTHKPDATRRAHAARPRRRPRRHGSPLTAPITTEPGNTLVSATGNGITVQAVTSAMLRRTPDVHRLSARRRRQDDRDRALRPSDRLAVDADRDRDGAARRRLHGQLDDRSHRPVLDPGGARQLAGPARGRDPVDDGHRLPAVGRQLVRADPVRPRHRLR